MKRHIHAIVVGLCFLMLAPGCQQPEEAPTMPVEEEPVMLECSEELGGHIFEDRIAPLITDEHPASCGRCHLPGIDFRQFFTEDACASVACLEEEELISLTYPERSKLLDWVERGHEKAMRTLEEDPLVRAEHDALLTWIEYHARCNHQACPDIIDNPCGKSPPIVEQDMAADMLSPGDDMSSPGEDMTLLDDMSAEDMPVEDMNMEPEDMGPPPDPCSRRGLEQHFARDVWNWHGRCYHCHADTYSERSNQIPKPPPWMSDDRSTAGAHLTARRLLEGPYLNLEEPSQSLILLKPLVIEEGGLEHKGGSKMANTEDIMYVPLIGWIEQVAACQEQEE